MAAYVQFYLNRGAVSGKQIVPASDIDRMEIPQSTWAAKQGLKAGYGLSNYWSFHDGFVYHGHNGGVEGGLTDMSYMPDLGVGYFYSINSGNGAAFDKIGKAIRAYLTVKHQKPELPPVAAVPANAEEYAGWYEPDSPRNELTHFLERLAGLTNIEFKDGKMLMKGLGNWNSVFIPVSGAQFRYVAKEEAPEPVATTELLTPNSDGRFIQAGAGTTLKKIPGWLALTEILLALYVALSMVSILIYAPFWILGGLSKRRRRPAERGMRGWPLIAVLSLVAFVAIFILCSSDLIERLGNRTVWSEMLFLTTIVFGIATLASAVAWWRTPAQAVRQSVRIYSRLVTVALLIAAFYLAYWDVIGIRTWQ